MESEDDRSSKGHSRVVRQLWLRARHATSCRTAFPWKRSEPHRRRAPNASPTRVKVVRAFGYLLPKDTHATGGRRRTSGSPEPTWKNGAGEGGRRLARCRDGRCGCLCRHQLGGGGSQCVIGAGPVGVELQSDHFRHSVTRGERSSLPRCNWGRGRHDRQPEPVPGHHHGRAAPLEHGLCHRLHDKRSRHVRTRMSRCHAKYRDLEFRDAGQWKLACVGRPAHGGGQRGAQQPAGGDLHR
jgi:hypothetical protein